MRLIITLIFLIPILLSAKDISNVDLSIGTSSDKKTVKVFDEKNRQNQTVSTTNKTKKFYENNRQKGVAFTRGNTTTFKDKNGRVSGTAVKSGNSIVYYNKKGQKVKTVRNDSSDRQSFYDKGNSKIGSKNRNKFYDKRDRIKNRTSEQE